MQSLIIYGTVLLSLFGWGKYEDPGQTIPCPSGLTAQQWRAWAEEHPDEAAECPYVEVEVPGDPTPAPLPSEEPTQTTPPAEPGWEWPDELDETPAPDANACANGWAKAIETYGVVTQDARPVGMSFTAPPLYADPCDGINVNHGYNYYYYGSPRTPFFPEGDHVDCSNPSTEVSTIYTNVVYVQWKYCGFDRSYYQQ